MTDRVTLVEWCKVQNQKIQNRHKGPRIESDSILSLLSSELIALNNTDWGSIHNDLENKPNEIKLKDENKIPSSSWKS